jgi:dienelactone hydrolase
MRTYYVKWIMAALTGIAGAGHAQTITDEPPPAELAAEVKAATDAAQAGGTGPLHAVMVSDPLLPTHSLYRPATLPKAKLPIIAWGNGACANIGNRFRYYLTEIASHGYLILATGPVGPPVVEWKIQITNRVGPPPPGTPAPSQASQLTDAINWAIGENGRKASPYYHRLDPRKIAVMGQSCGGLQAISAGADRRVKTVMVMNSGTFPDANRPLDGTGNANKASLKSLHSPIAYISGDESDIAHKNANADFDAINHVPVFRAWKHGIGHSDAYRHAFGGPFAPVATAWLDWQLKGDARAGAMFAGHDCGLCRDSAWVVSKKRIK